MKIQYLTEAVFIYDQLKHIGRHLKTYENYHPNDVPDLLDAAKKYLVEEESVKMEMEMKRVWNSIISLLEKRQEILIKQVESL